jgi:hypothetical protein
MLNTEAPPLRPSKLSPLPSGRTIPRTMREDSNPEFRLQTNKPEPKESISLLDGTVVERSIASNLYHELKRLEEDIILRSLLEELVRKVYDPTYAIPKNSIDSLAERGLVNNNVIPNIVAALVRNMYEYDEPSRAVEGTVVATTKIFLRKSSYPWNEGNSPFVENETED